MATKKSSGGLGLSHKQSVSGTQLLLFALSFGLVGGIISWAAFAAPANKGGGKTGGYIITVTPAAPYTFGESVYTTTTAPQVAQSYIGITCYQNGTVVATGSHANWSGGWYFNWPWVLGQTGLWQSGAGDCTFTAYHVSHYKIVNDATTTIHVNG